MEENFNYHVAMAEVKVDLERKFSQDGQHMEILERRRIALASSNKNKPRDRK
jgi:hypothetical protein